MPVPRPKREAEESASPDGVRDIGRGGGHMARDAEPANILPECHGVREHHCLADTNESSGRSSERDSRRNNQ